ncbi:hypothetical protein HDU87_004060 [Geranomyces variabilis]|uniref:Zinc finger C2H2 LYAR-type domain-containing protein n=1 Tax=Geranomyces variabilis TaxID=109894 RepID=A0AAD5TRJ6_9FUNG|nr:hypothetical protein HDU87_004060 [Geranomyces variabilis]
MVSFVCEACQETLKKPKLEQHTYRCQYAQFSCIDCSTTFQGTDYRAHTSCISEAEKYQGALYKGPKKNGTPAKNGKQAKKQAAAPSSTPVAKNIAVAPPAESLIAQIQKADAAAASTTTATTTTTSTTSITKRQLDTDDTTADSSSKKAKKEKKDKKKDKKEIKAEDAVSTATTTTTAAAAAAATAESVQSPLQAAVKPAVAKVLKKSPTLTIAELRQKTVKRLAKSHAGVKAEELGRAFDAALSVSVGSGGAYTLSL